MCSQSRRPEIRKALRLQRQTWSPLRLWQRAQMLQQWQQRHMQAVIQLPQILQVPQKQLQRCQQMPLLQLRHLMHLHQQQPLRMPALQKPRASQRES